MKTLRLPLVIALAAFALQGCDINVKPPATQAAAPQPAPLAEQPAAPQPAPVTEQPAAPLAQQPAAPVDATPTPEAPATSAMGAQPGEATPTPSDGVAAPTELALFFEQNPIKPKAQ